MSSGKEFSIYYAIDEKWNMLASEVDAYYLTASHAYGFIGTTVGLYSKNKNF